MYRQFRVPGVTITDVQKFTRFSNVKGACQACGIELYQLTETTYNPLSPAQIKKLLLYIRAKQGDRLLRRLEKDATG
jgi:hypothetical protein